VIGKQLDEPLILPGGMYNIDETGVLLIVFGSSKVLVYVNDLRP
jgi:TATA-box binding protein (TBP) (component of TFIID and TFIIIB)